MNVKTFYIFNKEKIEIGWLGSSASKTKVFRIYGDTNIISAKMYLNTWISRGCLAGCDLNANKQNVCSLTWYPWEGGSKNCEGDVTGIVGKNDNKITVTCLKNPIVCPEPLTFIVTVILTIEYEGKEPQITPPSPPIVNTLRKVLPAFVVGACAGAGAIIEWRRKHGVGKKGRS